uniref:BUB1 mitotic checkpoint serine/threonine kinase n=1 Tax=Tetraodon nigroviridis TaxID=99883 RepID=H3CAW4_TETNG
ISDSRNIFRRFEKSFSLYTGDDPLDPWDKFVDYLEQRTPEGEGRGLSQVFDSLVQRFLNVERYSDDLRYVNYCIKCASFHPDPVALYTHVYSSGVGHRTAALHLAWAQQLELRGMLEQADAVYQRAVKNQAQPADTILNEYRQFQTRTKHQTLVSVFSENRNPLQNSQLTNQMASHREHHKASMECSSKPPTIETIITSESCADPGSPVDGRVTIVSRSETSGTSRSSSVQFVSEYLKEELLCEGSELCFEEVRATKYFRQAKVQQEDRTSMVLFVKDAVDLAQKLGKANRTRLNREKEAEVDPSAAWNINAAQHSSGQEQPCSRGSSRRSLALRLEGQPLFLHRAAAVPDHRQEQRNATPEEQPCAPVPTDTSVLLPTQQMAPPPQDVSSSAEKVLPHEDLEIGAAQDEECRPEPGDRLNMSQGGTGNLSHVTPNTSLGLVQATPSRVLPSPTVNTREALDVIMDMFQAPTLLGDPFSNTSAFPARRPRQRKQPVERTSVRGRWSAPLCVERRLSVVSHWFSVAAPHPPLKPKPIKALAEIPLAKRPNETPPELTPDESTTWGAGYNSLNSLAACPNSTTDFAMLAQFVSTPFVCKTPHSSNFFQDEDQTVCTRTTFNPDPERPPKPASPSPPRRQAFPILEDPVCDVSMSPERALQPDWLNIRSPEAPPETDLDAFLSPCGLRTADVPMTPEPASPATAPPMDAMASPDRGWGLDVSMNPATPPCQSSPVLMSDPWDEQLISQMLSTLTPPLSSHPHYTAWSFGIPAISPSTTITMGEACLRVDCVLGQGAFATVYKATNPTTSDKMVLKVVQKPANPWEFYINTQLDARLQPAARHLYANIRSAHLFTDGSVLLADLHQYGTLLNAVNIYRSLSEKVMPPPLVLYFTTCILRMVEQLHAISIIHADIKPDNFLLGERFLENQCFEPENLDHGLVLVDLGQSVDMALFPDSAVFTAKCLTSGFQCTEMLSGRPWNYQTDYFGVAGTVYCMLFGTYMQVTNDGGVWRTNGVFRRIPHSELWQEFFHALLNVPDCSSPSSLPHLREKLTCVLQQNYSSSKLRTLKSRLLVQLLERRKTAA